jgi:hypothetical protein
MIRRKDSEASCSYVATWEVTSGLAPNCNVQWCLALAEPGVISEFSFIDLNVARLYNATLNDNVVVQTKWTEERSHEIRHAIYKNYQIATTAEQAQKNRFNQHPDCIECYSLYTASA